MSRKARSGRASISKSLDITLQVRLDSGRSGPELCCNISLLALSTICDIRKNYRAFLSEKSHALQVGEDMLVTSSDAWYLDLTRSLRCSMLFCLFIKNTSLAI